ncbi:HD domain-containing protein [bacterium]|nr:HD domain-containing protein [bacterium]
MSIIRQPDFKVPIDKVLPGMVLARNLQHDGQMLLRHGLEMDSERIEKLKEMGVAHLYIQFNTEDVDLYKEYLTRQASPPDYESLVETARASFLETIPSFARPKFCARSAEVHSLVLPVIRHTLDVIFSSQRLFTLFSLTHFFQLGPLTHCPAAWVYALCTGAGLDYSMPALIDLSLASLFYDIGMLKLPPRVLAKPGRLTELEWAEIKKHTYFGRKMLEDVGNLPPSAALVAFEHHENYYGGGYPKNKRGDQINEFAQVVSLADKFAALVTARGYRDRFQPYQAYEMLLSQTKSAVSPRVFVAFLKSVLIYPRGSLLRLSNGEIAEPVSFEIEQPTRPTVLVTYTSSGEEIVGNQRRINLAEHPNLSIEAFNIVEDHQQLFARGGA